MAVAENEPVPEHNGRLSNDIEKVNDTIHTEHQERNADYIPQNDSEYQVTFKTWIVVTV